jgi:hypothetical protein
MRPCLRLRNQRGIADGCYSSAIEAYIHSPARMPEGNLVDIIEAGVPGI